MAATVAAVCLFCPHPFFLTLILGAVIFFLIRISDSTQIDFMVILQAGFIGAVAEFLAVITGAWKYERPNFFVIPTWLPLLWGIAAHIITHIAARASRINQKKQ